MLETFIRYYPMALLIIAVALVAIYGLSKMDFDYVPTQEDEENWP